MTDRDVLRLPNTREFLVALVVALVVTGCQVQGERPSTRLYQIYPGTEIRQLGGYGGSHGHDGSVALLNGLGYLVGHGVQRSAIESASINGSWSLRRGLFAVGHRGLFGGDFDHSRPLYYDIWVKIEGCPDRVHMKANFRGRLIAVNDKGGCLTGAAS